MWQIFPREGWKRKSFFEVYTKKKIAVNSLTAVQRSGTGGTPNTKIILFLQRVFYKTDMPGKPPASQTTAV